MALYTLTVDLLAETGSFELDLGQSERAYDRAARAMRQMQREMSDSFAQAARDAEGSGIGCCSAAPPTSQLDGVHNGSVVFLGSRHKRSAQVSGRVPLSTVGGHGVPHHLLAVLHHPMG